MKRLLISLSAILPAACFCLNAFVLHLMFPDASTNYETWKVYGEVRIKIYEGMFMLFFLNMALVNRGAIKAVCWFAFFMAASSFLDKTFFHKNMYLYSDIIVGCVSAVVAFLIYLKEKWKPPLSS